jgi:hypothetical protein
MGASGGILDGEGSGGGETTVPEALDDDTALDLIMFVYGDLNYYGIRTPEAEGASESFAGGTVTVTKTDSTDDVFNAYYSDDVLVEFSGYERDGDGISGSGRIHAFIDSGAGSEGARYDGSFEGSFDGRAYQLDMNYEATNSAGAGIQSGGVFTVNGVSYELEADSSMMYEYGVQ